MIRFLLKGVLRDRSRSLFPLLTVTAGVSLVVFLNGWIAGGRNDILWSNAVFSTGHVKVMTNAYAENIDLVPNDLAILGVDSLLQDLQQQYPNMYWSPRIKFGGLLDIPDAQGETRAQTIVAGLAMNLTTGRDVNIMELEDALVLGDIPSEPNEILISELLASQLSVGIGDTATLVSSTMYGSMAMHNFVISGLIRFGITAMDRSTIIANLPDVQRALDMQDAAGEILGFFPDVLYHDEQAEHMAAEFTAQQDASDEFAPQMLPLVEQGGLASLIKMFDSFSGVLIAIFIFAMGIVLWNAGLMGSLRRYGEIGLRLAVGEEKGHLYRTLVAESVLIGIGGAILGTIIGLIATYYMQVHGIDLSTSMQNSNLMMSNVFRAQIVPSCFYIGLVPGIIAPLLGTSLSGIGIYKRQTAQLFKELEV